MLSGGTIRTSITDHLGFNSVDVIGAIFWCKSCRAPKMYGEKWDTSFGQREMMAEILLKKCGRKPKQKAHQHVFISSFSRWKLHLEMLRLQIHSPSFSLRYVHQRDWVSAMRVAEVPWPCETKSFGWITATNALHKFWRFSFWLWKTMFLFRIFRDVLSFMKLCIHPIWPADIWTNNFSRSDLR